MVTASLHSIELRPAASAPARWIVMGLLSVAATTLATPSHAQNLDRATSVPKVTVDFSDLNLSKPADAAKLYKRLQLAATEVCGRPDLRDMKKRQLQRQCYHNAITNAVHAVDHAAVNALYRSDDKIKVVQQRSNESASS